MEGVDDVAGKISATTSMEDLDRLAQGEALGTKVGEGVNPDPLTTGNASDAGNGEQDSITASSGGSAEETHDKEKNFAALRAKNREMANQLQQAQDDAERIRQELEQLRESERQKTQVNLPTIAELDEQIKALRDQAEEISEDAPSLAQTFQKNADALQKTRDYVTQIETERLEQVEREKNAAAEKALQDTQSAIDATPVLKHWQQNDPDAFNLAADQDRILRARPEWANKPLAERFAKAVEITRQLLPEAPLPTNPSPSQKQESASTKPEGAKPTETAPIASLSDVPGGLPPAKNMTEQIDGLSGAALQNRMQNMTREQQDALLASLEM